MCHKLEHIHIWSHLMTLLVTCSQCSRCPAGFSRCIYRKHAVTLEPYMWQNRERKKKTHVAISVRDIWLFLPSAGVTCLNRLKSACTQADLLSVTAAAWWSVDAGQETSIMAPWSVALIPAAEWLSLPSRIHYLSVLQPNAAFIHKVPLTLCLLAQNPSSQYL